jgi:hypothetical protein
MILLSPGVRAQSPTLQAGDIYGTDFVSGAAAADLAGYVTPFLQSGRFFELTSQWAQGRFIVRDTDANGRPLLGPTSTGSVDGALIAYRLGLRTSPQRPVGVFFLADYFVASHLNSFFDLLTPSKTTPGDNLTGGEWDTGYRGRYYLSWIVPLGLVRAEIGAGRVVLCTLPCGLGADCRNCSRPG